MSLNNLKVFIVTLYSLCLVLVALYQMFFNNDYDYWPTLGLGCSLLLATEAYKLQPKPKRKS